MKTLIRINCPLLIGATHHEAGACVPVPEARAVELIDQGLAERAEVAPPEPPATETADLKRPPVERATKLVSKAR